MKGKVLIKGRNPCGTRIFLDGKEIENVRAFHCSQRVAEPMTLTLELLPSEVEIQCDGMEITCLNDTFVRYHQKPREEET